MLQAYGGGFNPGSACVLALIVFTACASLARAQAPPAGGYSISGPINLTGSGYEYDYTDSAGRRRTSRFGAATALNTSGEVAGYSARVYADGFMEGYDAWFYDGSITRKIGLTGGVYSGGLPPQSSYVSTLDNQGTVTGSSDRGAFVMFLGVDVWAYRDGTTRQIGLSGGDYSYTLYNGTMKIGTYESSFVSGSLGSGAAYGGTHRYDASGKAAGTDVWLYDGASTRQVGFTGAGYSYAMPSGTLYQSSSIAGSNSAGVLAGNSERYDSSGTDWLYRGAATTRAPGLTGDQYSYTSPTGQLFRSNWVGALNNAGQMTGDTARQAAGFRLREKIS